ncbi:MAG: monovalent cation:proton antiporter-2 (CPA2) family protein [Rhodocyclaceae bacterium]|nr:monovalent cation:proton antiporter-2 (CPA2) family protein [Rhodocyclaceae bacterium]
MTLHMILWLLAAAVAAVALFRAFNLPPILGYLCAGALIGPHALGVVPEVASAQGLAEFGVVFLMFTIGLEFSLPRLYAMKRHVFGLGSAQVALTMVGVTLLASLWGVSLQASVILGGALAMSSTAILSKLLTDRHELDAPHGRETIGVLLFQDLAVVPLIVLVPALAKPLSALPAALGLAMLKAAFLLVLVLALGQKLMRAWLSLVAKRKSSELFLLNVLLVTLAFSAVSEAAGLSAALGAFVAGMLIAETEYRYQVEDDIKPFRDVLLGFFFLSVGMTLDFAVIAHDALPVVVVLLLLLLGKFALTALVSRLLGASAPTALRSGLWLAGAGEFGFVLISQGVAYDLIDPARVQPILAAMVLSMMLTPLLVHHSDRIVLRLAPSEWFARSLAITQLAAQTVGAEKHVLICGFGKTGQHLARFLEAEGIGFIALDLDPELVHEAASAGEPVVWGDALRRENLIAAGLPRAQALVVTFTDLSATLHLVAQAKALRPDLPIVVRAREEHDVEKLYAAGVAEVVPEALESSVMLATHALALAGVPMARVIKRLRALREEHYAMLRGFFHGAEAETEHEGPRLKAIVLDAEAWAVGKTLQEVDLARFGVRVTAIRRKHAPRIPIADATGLAAGDIVVVSGQAQAIARAEARLLQGKP